ncbi:hypothetical protein [Paenarthrobacter sp. 2TAF44]|uniref:hypothetical protein n=1 Tax=Paenarthrobacter sp. 2TAF44 TaxID=3233018 RepID=UPI003F9A82B2
MTNYRHDQWHLLIGAIVETYKNGDLIRSGRVDDAMSDSSLIWLAADGPDTRALFDAADGVEVWVEPRQLDGKMSYRMTRAALKWKDDANAPDR